MNMGWPQTLQFALGGLQTPSMSLERGRGTGENTIPGVDNSRKSGQSILPAPASIAVRIHGTTVHVILQWIYARLAVGLIVWSMAIEII